MDVAKTSIDGVVALLNLKKFHFLFGRLIDLYLDPSISFLNKLLVIVKDQAPKCNITSTLVMNEILRILAEWWIWLLWLQMYVGVATTWYNRTPT